MCFLLSCTGSYINMTDFLLKFLELRNKLLATTTQKKKKKTTVTSHPTPTPKIK